MPAIAGKYSLAIAGDKVFRSIHSCPGATKERESRACVVLKEKCCVVFHYTAIFFLIKGGLMEPNGILCEVQPVL